MRNTRLEVSRGAFLNNVNAVRKYVGGDILIMPVVKANAYGTYLNRDIDLMNHFDIIAVAIVDEAVDLRKRGYKKNIFVLNQPYDDELDIIAENDIIVGVSSFSFLEKAIASNKNIRVHIEIETGMGRTGVAINELDNFIKLIKSSSNVIVEGVYTHLSSADVDYEFTNKQIDLFKNAFFRLKDEFPSIKYAHCSASNGILNFKLDFCNLVRPGIILYGYPSSKSAFDKIKLEPVARFVSKISFVKNVDIGDSISYGRSFVASKKMVVATVGCGYADGVMRDLSNKGYVCVRGCRCKILGNVCMDSFVIDVSNVKDVSVFDDVYIFDNENVTLEELSFVCETINYEFISSIGERVPRIFVE